MALSRRRKALIGWLAALVIGGAAAGAAYVLKAGPAVATVDGVAIPASEFTARYDAEKRQYATRFGVDFAAPQGKQIDADLRRGVLSQLIDRQVIMNAAKAKGVKPDEAAVTAKYEQTKAGFPDEKAFAAALEQHHTTPDQLKAQIREGQTVEALAAAVAPSAPVPKADAERYYREHRDLFAKPEEASARHILIKDEALAKKVLAELKAGGDFAELANVYSEDLGSKTLGGELGYFGRGKMVPEFEAAAFALKPGERSGLVKTQFGYHILEGRGRHPARTPAFKEVEGEIVSKLGTEKRQAAFEAWLAEAKRRAAISYAAGYDPAQAPAAPALAPEPGTVQDDHAGHEH